MIQYRWNNQKNDQLRKERGVSFEKVVLHIEQGDLLDIVQHPNIEKYPNQKILIVYMQNYIYVIPFVEEEGVRFLKTIIPNRKLTKKYMGDNNEQNTTG